MPPDRLPPAGTDVAALARALAREVRGAVRFDAGSRAVYATDASNYRQVPIGVVVPESADDVAAAVAVCRRFGAPVLTRGAGTSLAGQCCNAAVVLDFSRHLRRVLEVDPARRLARVEPGAVLDDLRREAERHGLTFGPDPATHAYCTLGGMIGNDSCGVHSVLARFEGEGGRTADNVAALDVLTSDGERLRVGATREDELREIVAAGGRRGRIYGALAALRDRHAAAIRERFPPIPRRVSGYNLPALLPENGFHVARALVGSEGTCATVLEATLHLIPSPPARVLLVAAYPDVFAAADVVPQVLAHRPAGLEGLDDGLVADARSAGLSLEGLALLPEGGGWLLVELGAESVETAAAKARTLEEDLRGGRPAPRTRVFTELAQQRRVWAVRESGLPATAHPAGRPLTWEGWEDSAVAPEKLGPYLRDLRRLWERHGYRGDLYGHFGDGCVHTRLDFDLESKAGIARFRAFVGEAADLVLSYGGSLSGEHGDGQARAELLPKMFGPELVEAFREFKRIWDPDGLMNPGKVVDPNPIVANLRLEGGLPGPPGGATVFRFPQDGGDFSRATLRCVGVGKCRRDDGDTMCPSFRATGEERHSTRGRARLLFEMLRGEVVRGGWESDGGQGGARPVSLVQGLPVGVSRRRGHGGLQGRVPAPLLCGAPPTALGPDLRIDPPLGARRLSRSPARQFPDWSARALADREGVRRSGARARDPAARTRHLPGLVSRADRSGARRRRPGPAGPPLSRHVHRRVRSGDRPRLGASAGSGGIYGRDSRRRPLLRPAPLRLGPAPRGATSIKRRPGCPPRAPPSGGPGRRARALLRGRFPGRARAALSR